MFAQSGAPCRAPLTLALDGFRKRLWLLAENEGSGSRGSASFVVPRMGAMVNSERPYSLLVSHNRRKALAVMRQASGTEEGYGGGAVGR